MLLFVTGPLSFDDNDDVDFVHNCEFVVGPKSIQLLMVLAEDWCVWTLFYPYARAFLPKETCFCHFFTLSMKINQQVVCWHFFKQDPSAAP